MRLQKIAAAAIVSLSTGSAHALLFDQNVTNNAIFGSGNANGGYTVDSQNGIELGLRAKVRYDVVDNQPKNIFNSNGDGTYSHAIGAPGSNPDRARWNFEWSINTDASGTTGLVLSDLVYNFEVDIDPSAAVNFVSLGDIINVALADHSIGTNATAQGAGAEAGGNAATYANLIGNNNLAQNSGNMAFLSALFLPGSFDPNAQGRYDFRLTASRGNSPIASTSMQVLVGIPEPASLGLVLAGVTGFVARRRRA